MSSIVWTRSEEKHPGPHYHIIGREYTPKDKEWPRLFMRIYGNGSLYFPDVSGYEIFVSYQEGANDWIDSHYPLPAQLINDLKEMLDEVVKK